MVQSNEQEYKIYIKVTSDDLKPQIKPQDVILMQRNGEVFTEISHLKNLSLTVSQDFVDFHFNTSRRVELAKVELSGA